MAQIDYYSCEREIALQLSHGFGLIPVGNLSSIPQCTEGKYGLVYAVKHCPLIHMAPCFDPLKQTIPWYRERFTNGIANILYNFTDRYEDAKWEFVSDQYVVLTFAGWWDSASDNDDLRNPMF